MSTYYKLGSLVEGLTTTATTGGTTTLVVSSRPIQVFTGTLSQTVVLPDATTLSITRRFDINNRSTGSITVQANGGATLTVIPAGSQRYFLCTSISTSAGTWVTGGVTSGGGSSGLTTTDKMNILGGVADSYSDSSTITSRTISYDPEQLGGDYWVSKLPLATARAGIASFTLGNRQFLIAGSGGNTETLRFDRDTNFYLSRAAAASYAASRGFSDGTYGYVVGGYVSPPVNLAFRFDDTANSWVSRANLPIIKSGGALGYEAGRATYMAGNDASTIQYAVGTDTWLTKLTVYPDSVIYSLSGAQHISKTWAMGGDAASTTGSTSVKAYDEATNAITIQGSLNQGRRYAAGFEVSGLMCSAGGYTAPSFTGIATMEAYDYTSRVWKIRNSFSLGAPGRGELPGNVTSCLGFALVAGGYRDGPGYLANVDEYKGSAWMNVGVVKRSKAALTSILGNVASIAFSGSVPIQVRTDGDSWKTLLAGTDSMLRSGETYDIKFKRSGKLFAAGGYIPVTGHDTSTEMYSPSSNTWVNKTSMLSAHTSGMARWGIDGYGMVGGGNTNVIEEYNDETNAWNSNGTTPDLRTVSACFLIDNIGYTAGGNLSGYLSSTYSYNRGTGTWTSRAALVGTARGYAASFALQGKGYVVGGFNGGALTNTDVYNPATNSYSAGATAYAAQGSAGNASESAGLGYKGSGYNIGAGVVSDSSSWFDPITNTWTAFNVNVPALQYDLYGDWIEGRGYNVSGATTSGFTTANLQYGLDSKFYVTKTGTNTAREFGMLCQPGQFRRYEVRVGVPILQQGVGSGIWKTMSNLTTANNQKERFSISDKIYANDNVSFQRYDTTLDVTTYFTPAADTARTTFAAATNADRGFLISGYNGSFIKTVEIYNPESSSWISAASTTNDHYSGSAFALNGSIYAISSYNNSSTERYNPSVNTWTTLANAVGGQIGQNTANAFEGYGYNIGGSYGGSPTNQTQYYSDAGNVWVAGPNCLVVRDYSCNFVIPSGLTVAGNSASFTATTEKLNRSLAVWVYSSAMNTGSQATAHCEGNGGGYRVGGYNGSALVSIERYSESIKNTILGMALEVK